MGTAQAQHAASMSPSTFVEGGLWDDIDARITDAAWVKFNFSKEGAAARWRLALALEFTPLAGLEPDQQPYQQMYSAGDLKYFVPSVDDEGAFAVPVGDKSALNLNSNTGALLASLVECCPDADAYLKEGNSKNLIGFDVHVKRFPQKERKGLSAEEDGNKGSTILLITNVLALPGEGPEIPTQEATAPAKTTPPRVAGPGKPAARPAARPAVTAGAVSRPAVAGPGKAVQTVSGKVNGQAVAARPAPSRPAAVPAGMSDEEKTMKAGEAVFEVLSAAADGVVEFGELPKLAFRTEALKTVPPKTRNEICGIIFDEGWIASVEGITYDATTSTVQLG